MSKEITDFKAFVALNEKQTEKLWRRFVSKNKPDDIIKRRGFIMEYDAHRDYLYITFGMEPKEGIVVEEDEEFIFLADPETLEAVGLEIPFFMAKVNDNSLGKPWQDMAKLIKHEGKIVVPPDKERESFSKTVAGLMSG